jgi:proline iminopeptidase
MLVGRRLLRLGIRLLLLIATAAFCYAAVADVMYRRVPAVAEPCRDCAPPARVLGYELYYRELGVDTGLPPVVVVHGGPGHSSLSFKRSLDFLGANRRVIYYDQRGSGNSEAKPNPDDYRVEALVDELEALRREVIKADRVVVVGHSFGGAVAQRFALAHPDRVAALVLVGSVRANNGMSSRVLWNWFGPALWSTVLGLPPGDPVEADRWFGNGADDADAKARLFDPTRAEEILDGAGRVRFTTWREVSLSAAGYGYAKELTALQVPTLFIYGRADSPWTGKPAADEVCGLIPACTAVAFERSGHWPFLEEPERFQAVLTEFLSKE